MQLQELFFSAIYVVYTVLPCCFFLLKIKEKKNGQNSDLPLTL